MGGDTSSDAAQPLVIIVPRADPELCRTLSRSFNDDGTVKVILDRRLVDRRLGADEHRPERRRGERRRRADMEEELRAGRWVAIPRAAGRIDFLDPDVRAILFLCCSQHVVPCQACQNIYRLSWILRANSRVFPCPRCGNDLTPTVIAHAHTCRYRLPGILRPRDTLAEAPAD